ncbi:MAG: triose-phosphate isomerase [Dehalococcoidia bacterium]
MANPFVAGNWKMHTTLAEAVELAGALRSPLSEVQGVTRVVCPPFVSLAEVKRVLAESPIAVGAQNMHPEPKGAFTGEVAGAMLQGVCTHVVLGHSERRQLFGEQDGFINEKVHTALALGLTPILCVGETLEEREANQASAVVERQLSRGLNGISADDVAQVVIAYEPVWAIGTGRAATPDIAQEMIGGIRGHIATLVHAAAAAQVPVLYGGSVNAKNAAELAAQQDIDGALVGGASLQPAEFVEIAKAFAARSA